MRRPLHMVMITQFDRYINPETGKVHICGKVYPNCPKCKNLMKFRDTCNRHSKDNDSECTWYVLRRFQCCGNTHREIPDFLFPYKHYDADVVQAAIDGDTDGFNVDESTIRRWRKQWLAGEAHIRLILLAFFTQSNNELPRLTGTGADIIDLIKAKHSRWLAFVLRMLTVGCFPLYTQFAFCHSP